MKKTFNLGGVTITVECEEQPKRQTVAPHRCVCNHVVPTRGGEGIMVAVQKPEPQFYENSWRGNATYRDHLNKYRNLENAAAACNWPNDLIDNGTIQWPVPQKNTVIRQQPRDVNGRFTSRNSCGCSTVSWPQREVRQKCGIVPVGAVVVDHTWNGEPIFDR